MLDHSLLVDHAALQGVVGKSAHCDVISAIVQILLRMLPKKVL